MPLRREKQGRLGCIGIFFGRILERQIARRAESKVKIGNEIRQNNSSGCSPLSMSSRVGSPSTGLFV